MWQSSIREKIFSSTCTLGEKKGHGVEKRLGNPSFTPAAIASLEVAEIVKILLKKEPLLPRRYLVMDLYHTEFTEVFFPEEK
jgi:hypothetical protein